MEEQDEEIVRRCLNGDAIAFETLVERYQRRVFNVVLRMLNDYEEARDVAQNVFIKVFRGLGSYDPSFKFFNWIYRIAIHESLDQIQRRRPTDPLDERRPSASPGPERSAQRTALRAAIEKALMTLTPDYRAVIVLRHFRECSYTEMAQILDIPEKTVKSRLYSARQLLKDALESDGWTAA